jgi:hypothetical protein
MKAKVITSFVDKTGVLNTVGSEVNFGSSRIETLEKRGFVARVKENPANADVEKPAGEA